MTNKSIGRQEWLYVYKHDEKDDTWIFDRTVSIHDERRSKERLKELESFGRAGVYTPEIIPGAYY